MPKGAGKGRVLRAVVVDDHADTRDMTAEVLASGGFSVVCCETLEAALVEIRRDPPDVVVTDILLGRGHGVELAHAVRADHAGVVLVAVSGVADPDAHAIGVFDAYCVKPIDIATFPAQVRRLVDGRKVDGDGR